MDEDTFNAIRALHDVFYDLKDDGDDDSSNRNEHRHRSIEPPSYHAYAAFGFIDAGDDSQQHEGQDYRTILSNNYHDASASSSSSSSIHHYISDSSDDKEQHHPSIEPLYDYDAYYAAYKVVAGDDSEKHEGHPYPTIASTIESTIDQDASSSSIHHNMPHRMETLSTDLKLERFDITTHSSCILRDKNTVFIAAILITIVVYPMIGTRLRSKWWVKNRITRSLSVSKGLEEDGGATSYSCAQDMLERGVH
eukprot:CAMPEP_0201700702 /NCGR_PEP_ID=MMETSP0578-20130828/29563_1 /ASSEMBLY_ACC=CAM_ASM_000663 /TAXON_ID=267565 /ORGANISM="Skeletonema grethea, Strain CCMP 1804" /LENGTH=250 /DNA_ID=CAMNT_0048187813 /DNA_START=30 /DNA_END=782 /DNA_ORIENTATION=+